MIRSRMEWLHLKVKVNTMQQWVFRREKSHKPYNADELWKRIRQNWPTLTEEEAEYIFANSVPKKGES